MRMILRDLAFAFRTIRRSPAFALTAILTLALGAGATAAVSAVAYGILFRPLPFAAPDRLVAVWPLHFLSQRDLRYLRDRATGLGSVAAIAPGWTFSLTGAGDPRRITVDRVSANLFETLGAPAALGRTLRSGEDAPGAPGRLVLSYRFWQEQFGGDPSIVGWTVRVDDAPHQIIGVMPRDFEIFRPGTDAWAPLPADPSAFYHALNFSLFVGRLSPGVPLARADAAFRSLMPSMRAELGYPEGFGRTATLEDLRETTTGSMRSSLALLMATVAFVLLIAGANLGVLVVARSTARSKELALLAAVGVSRAAVVRLQLFEVVVLSALGGAAGLALARLATPALVGLLPAYTPRASGVAVDGTVAALVLGATVLVAVVFGIAPALAAGRGVSATVLREGAATQSPGARRTRGAMVAVQIALALVLAIGAGLMLQSLWRLQHVESGMDIDHVLTLRLQPSSSLYKQGNAARDYDHDVLARIAALPGVSATGAIQHLPFSGIDWVDGYEPEDQPMPAGAARPTAGLKIITGDYFAAVGQPIVAGRAFSTADETTSDEVVIVNAALASKLYGQPERAIGRRLRTGRQAGPWRTIVGVVGDVRTKSLASPPEPELYEVVGSGTIPALMVAIRGDGDPLALVAAAREAVWSVDRGVPVSDLQPMSRLVGRHARRTPAPPDTPRRVCRHRSRARGGRCLRRRGVRRHAAPARSRHPDGPRR